MQPDRSTAEVCSQLCAGSADANYALDGPDVSAFEHR